MPRCPLRTHTKAVGRPWVLIAIRKRETQQDGCRSGCTYSVIRAIKGAQDISLDSDREAKGTRFLKCGFVPLSGRGAGWGGVGGLGWGAAGGRTGEQRLQPGATSAHLRRVGRPEDAEPPIVKTRKVCH